MKPKTAMASVRYSNIQMFMGLMLSFSGSAVIEGTVPTLIATGLLATIWIPFYTTLSGIINAAGVFLSRLLMDRSPYQVLLLCDLYDLSLTTLAIIATASGYISLTKIVVVYLLGSACLPVLTNIANNTYVGSLSLRSRVAANRFNVISLFLMTIATLVVARPVGSFFVGHSLYLIFLINLLLTLVSLGCRWQALKNVPTSMVVTSRRDRIAFFQRLNVLETLRYFKGHVFSLKDTSPLIISLLYLSIGLFLYYLPLWLANPFSHKGSIIALVEACGGAGSTFGPLMFGWLGGRFSLRNQVMACVMGTALLEGITLLLIILCGAPKSWHGLLMFLPLVFGLFLVAAYCNIAALTSRQQRFAGKHYIEMVGLAYSFTALFTLMGSWWGYWLDASQNPLLSISVALGIAVMTWIGLLRHSSECTETAS
ncbi:hypothetical protein LMG33818_000158 [Halomonadaceae bacterium LMG 33818]|uniref:MFS transporter n=1 Tax=Cernens ardua TaxID=3402176 RepID=UPI003EDC3EEF